MAKLSQKELDHLKGLDRPAFEFANENVQRFFDRALEQGYSLDTTGAALLIGVTSIGQKQVSL